MKYKVSGQKIEPFISFGKMSMVKGFLDRKNFKKQPPDIETLCSWNHKNEIIKKEKNFRRNCRKMDILC